MLLSPDATRLSVGAYVTVDIDVLCVEVDRSEQLLRRVMKHGVHVFMFSFRQ
jgi:hypothetical protein